MTLKLCQHLWRSHPVRGAFWREFGKLVPLVICTVIAIAVIRYLRGKPLDQNSLWEIAVYPAVFVVARLISVVRTIRAVAREESLLEP